MKKDVIFTPILLVSGILLFLLRFTGLTAHIAISAVGVLLLIAYTVLTKKAWKIPALEIAMRACYGIALITGVIVMNVREVEALNIIHKISAVLFVVLLVILFVHKIIVSKRANG